VSGAAELIDPFRVVVLSGPSGSGKTTIVERLLRAAPMKLVKSVSATTRQPRQGEVHGDHYYFLTLEEFLARQARCEFLETAEVYQGVWYGTLRSEVDRARQAGGWSFLEIDVQGALSVIQLYPQAITIFIRPPSLAVCEQRLRDRGTETEEVLQRRLRKVEYELSLADRYRYQVVNDDLDAAVNSVLEIFARESRAAL
jgi:guanylate kinase